MRVESVGVNISKHYHVILFQLLQSIWEITSIAEVGYIDIVRWIKLYQRSVRSSANKQQMPLMLKAIGRINRGRQE